MGTLLAKGGLLCQKVPLLNRVRLGRLTVRIDLTVGFSRVAERSGATQATTPFPCRLLSNLDQPKPALLFFPVK